MPTKYPELVDVRMPERAIEIAEEIITSFKTGDYSKGGDWRASTAHSSQIDSVESDFSFAIDGYDMVALILNGDISRLQREVMSLINYAAGEKAKDEQEYSNETLEELRAFESREVQSIARSANGC